MPRTAAVLVASLALAATFAARAGDAQRGRALYEMGCGECHSESVHGRAHRVARDIGEVRGWVRRWSDELRLGWSADDIDDVAAYLNRAYYHFDCPATTCREVSMARLDRRP